MDWLRRVRNRLLGRVAELVLLFVFRVRIRSWFELDCRYADGRPDELLVLTNMVMNVGLAWLTAKLAGTEADDLEYLAGGTGSAAVDATHTALQGSELARVQGSRSQVTTTIADDTFQVESDFGAGVGTGTWEELGLFDAAASGTMFARVLTGTKVKNALDEFTARHKTQFQRP